MELNRVMLCYNCMVGMDILYTLNYLVYCILNSIHFLIQEQFMLDCGGFYRSFSNRTIVELDQPNQ